MIMKVKVQSQKKEPDFRPPRNRTPFWKKSIDNGFELRAYLISNMNLDIFNKMPESEIVIECFELAILVIGDKCRTWNGIVISRNKEWLAGEMNSDGEWTKDPPQACQKFMKIDKIKMAAQELQRLLIIRRVMES